MTQLYLPRNIMKWEFYFRSDAVSHSFISVLLEANSELTEFQLTNSPASHKQKHKSFRLAIWHPASFRGNYKTHI